MFAIKYRKVYVLNYMNAVDCNIFIVELKHESNNISVVLAHNTNGTALMNIINWCYSLKSFGSEHRELINKNGQVFSVHLFTLAQIENIKKMRITQCGK